MAAAGRSETRLGFPTTAQTASAVPADGHSPLPVAGTASSAREYHRAARSESQWPPAAPGDNAAYSTAPALGSGAGLDFASGAVTRAARARAILVVPLHALKSLFKFRDQGSFAGLETRSEE